MKYPMVQIAAILLLPLIQTNTLTAGELVTVGEQPIGDARFIGFKDGELECRIAKQLRRVPLDLFVRWSNPTLNIDLSEAVLSDGSRIVTAESWGTEPTLTFDGDQLQVSTRLLGDLVVPRQRVAAILLNGPRNLAKRQRLLDQLLQNSSEGDGILLENGDLLTGRVESLTAVDRAGLQIHMTPAGQPAPLKLPAKVATGLSFSRNDETAGDAQLVVGLRDGSQLYIAKIEAKASRLGIHLPCGLDLSLSEQEINYLQSLSSKVRYLSDMREEDYSHQPYLSLTRPLQKNRNLLGEPLTCAGLVYPIGIGMPSSARVIYKLKPGDKRFAAQVGVDDRAGHLGSMRFQVALMRDEEWEVVHSTKFLRGGQPPSDISVELSGASHIALETDSAEAGEECDYGNWLDARIE